MRIILIVLAAFVLFCFGCSKQGFKDFFINKGDTVEEAQKKSDLAKIAATVKEVQDISIAKNEQFQQNIFPAKTFYMAGLGLIVMGLVGGIGLKSAPIGVSLGCSGSAVIAYTYLHSNYPLASSLAIAGLAVAFLAAYFYESITKTRLDNALRQTVAGIQSAKKSILEFGVDSASTDEIDAVKNISHIIRDKLSNAHDSDSKDIIAKIKGK